MLYEKATLLRVLSVMSLLALLFTFASCKNENNKATESVNGENVPQEKKIYLPYIMLDRSGGCKYTYYYDENGNAFKVTQVSASGTETVLSEYEYKEYTIKVK